MTLQLKRYKITIDEYYKMAEVGILKPEDRVELIEGEILTMSPINTPHMGMVNMLTRILYQRLIDDYTISVQNPLRINSNTLPEPDFVIAKFRKDGYSNQAITPQATFLVIEVADSSYNYDRDKKTELYASAGVAEYWIIHLNKNQLEQYTQPKNGQYQSKQILKKTKTVFCSTIDF
ncbi:MAG: Uma2 family endonuclease [Bacteroidota bacterium]